MEAVTRITRTRHIGILATQGTIRSNTYQLELAKTAPDITVTGEACPLWVPLVENGEFDTPGTDYFVHRHIQNLLRQDPDIDTIILGCTHYPLLLPPIRRHTPPHVTVLPQGEYVAQSLQDYLLRHPEIEHNISRNATATFLTTEHPDNFTPTAQLFLNHHVSATHVTL